MSKILCVSGEVGMFSHAIAAKQYETNGGRVEEYFLGGRIGPHQTFSKIITKGIKKLPKETKVCPQN